MIKHIIVPALLAIVVAGCTPSEPPLALEPPTQTVEVSRDILTKGLRGGSNVPPEITRLTYQVTCTVEGGDITQRAQKAMQTMSQRYPYRDRQIGQGYQSGFEMRGVNPSFKDELGCLVNRPDRETVTRNQTEIVRFIATTPGLAQRLLPVR